LFRPACAAGIATGIRVRPNVTQADQDARLHAGQSRCPHSMFPDRIFDAISPHRHCASLITWRGEIVVDIHAASCQRRRLEAARAGPSTATP
jgi:hypothetical protein